MRCTGGVDEHVARVDPTVNEAGVVGGGECRGNRCEQVSLPLGGHGPVRHQVGERARPDESGGDELASLPISGLVDRDDVRMVERGAQALLGRQPRGQLRVLGELVAAEEPQRHGPAE